MQVMCQGFGFDPTSLSRAAIWRRKQAQTNTVDVRFLSVNQGVRFLVRRSALADTFGMVVQWSFDRQASVRIQTPQGNAKGQHRAMPGLGGKQTLGSGADSVPRRTMRAANRGRSVVRSR